MTKPFQIGAKCVGCGGCRSRYPAGAISADTLPFRIDPSRCTGCGRCVTACPLRAISNNENTQGLT